MKITTILLFIVLFKVISINLKLNKKESVPTNIVSTTETEEKKEKSFEVVKEVEEKQKIKDIKKDGVEEMVKDKVFSITKERLEEIEKDSEEQDALLSKLSFKQEIQGNEENEEEEMFDIDYDAILNTEFKVALAKNIQEEAENKWYDDPFISSLEKESKIDIPNTKKFKIIRYNY